MRYCAKKRVSITGHQNSFRLFWWLGGARIRIHISGRVCESRSSSVSSPIRFSCCRMGLSFCLKNRLLETKRQIRRDVTPTRVVTFPRKSYFPRADGTTRLISGVNKHAFLDFRFFFHELPDNPERVFVDFRFWVGSSENICRGNCDQLYADGMW